MKIQWCLAALAACSILPAASVSADVTIEMTVNGEPMTVATEAHKLRFEGADQLTIFRGDMNVLWTADAKQKTYTEMTQEEMKAAGQQLDAAMSQMQDAMKQLPPEQRAAVEQMMKQRQAPAKPAYEPTGETKTINGFACRGYTAADKGGVTEIWAADVKALKLDAADLAPFDEFSQFVKSMLPGMDQLGGFIKDYGHPAEGEFPGLPVLSIRKNAKGEETVRTELVKVEKGDVPAARFEMPAGYKKEKLPTRPSESSDE